MIIAAYYLIKFNNRYIECYADEKNKTTVIGTLDSQFKHCNESLEKERKMCKEDIREIKTERDSLNTELEIVRNNNTDCIAQLKYCNMFYIDCKKQLKEEETKRKNLEKAFYNATLEYSKAQKICEVDIRSIKSKLDDCEIRAKEKAKCQEDLHECNRKTCYIV